MALIRPAQHSSEAFARIPSAAALVCSLVVVLVAACTSDKAAPNAPGTSQTAATTGGVQATAPAVPDGAEDCGETNEFSGWPTTTVPAPSAYRCILDAVAGGTPTQMSHVSVGTGDSGRTTRDGYDLPTRRVVTWVVLGPHRVRQTTDETEDGGEVETQVCDGLVLDGYGSVPTATGCE